MRNLTWSAIALSFTILAVVNSDAVAQSKNLPKAPMLPFMDTFGGVASTIDRFGGTLNDLMSPPGQRPQSKPNQPVRPQPQTQPDPATIRKACHDALNDLQASINAYFQSLQNNYNQQIAALIRVTDFKEKQQRRMTLEQWWTDAQAIHSQLPSQITAKRKSCDDPVDHPSNSWTIEEGDRINAPDTTGLANTISYFIWNPPAKGPYRPDELLTLIKEPRILP